MRLPVVATMLKNELRKASKALAGETRGIAPGPMHVGVAQKRNSVPLVKHTLSAGPVASLMAIGVNFADPRQAGLVYQMLVDFSEDGVVATGDLQKQDKQKMHSDADEYASLTRRLALRVGYLPEEAERAAAVERCSMLFAMEVDGVVVMEFFGEEATGKQRTDFDNCLDTIAKLGEAYYLLRPLGE